MPVRTMRIPQSNNATPPTILMIVCTRRHSRAAIVTAALRCLVGAILAYRIANDDKKPARCPADSWLTILADECRLLALIEYQVASGRCLLIIQP